MGIYRLQYLSYPGIQGYTSDLSGPKGVLIVISTRCFSLFLSALDPAVLCVGWLPACGGKGDLSPPPLYIYVAPTASLLRRIVYVDIFSISPGLICESQWPYVASSSLNPSLFAGEQYSGQTWVRSSPPGLHGDHVLRIGHGSSPERCLQVITTPRKIVTNKEW